MYPPRRTQPGAGADPALPEPGDGSRWAQRQLREDPYEVVQRLAGDIGARPATSLNEAKAAAYLDGRLRRAGMAVSADPFRAVEPGGWEALLIALPALLAVALYIWLPLPSLLLALWTIALAIFFMRRATPLLGKRRTSQNVVATRAATEPRRWRIVLTAPLDSPAGLNLFGRAIRAATLPTWSHLAACLVLAALALAGLLPLQLDLVRGLWLAQFVPASALLLLAALGMWAARSHSSPGAISHAGALAGLLSVAEALGSLEYVELWAIALGSCSTGAGVADLLRRYPFDREETLVIGLEGIGAGSLCFVTGGDAPGRMPADPLLLEQAHIAGADLRIEVGPRAFRGGLTQAGRMRRAGLRSLALTCLDASGRVPLQSSVNDTPQAVDAAVLERAARFAEALARRFDTSN